MATYIDENGEKKTGTVANRSTAQLYQEAYDKGVEVNDAAAEAAKAEAQRQADYAKQTAAEQYQRANKQLYSDYMHAKKTLPEELAAYGINGGLAESSRVKLESGYTGNVNANLQAQTAGERDIDNGTAAAMYQANAQQAAANATAYQQYMSNLIAQQREKETNNANMLASIGDFSGMVALGYMTEDQAKKMQQAWIAQNPELAQKLGYVKPASSGGGTPGKGNKETIDLYELTKDMNYSEREQAVKDALEMANAGYADIDYSGFVGKTAPASQRMSNDLAQRYLSGN